MFKDKLQYSQHENNNFTYFERFETVLQSIFESSIITSLFTNPSKNFHKILTKKPSEREKKLKNPTNHINKDNYFVIKMEIVLFFGALREKLRRDKIYGQERKTENET